MIKSLMNYLYTIFGAIILFFLHMTAKKCFFTTWIQMYHMRPKWRNLLHISEYVKVEGCIFHIPCITYTDVPQIFDKTQK